MAELATLARPYAEAAFAAVRESGIPPAQAAQTLDQIAQVAADPALREVMGSPKISARQLADLVLGALPGSVPPALMNLVEMLAENRRFAAAGQIAEQFRADIRSSRRQNINISFRSQSSPGQGRGLIASYQTLLLLH